MLQACSGGMETYRSMPTEANPINAVTLNQSLTGSGLSLQASVNDTNPSFTKYLYSFPLPAGTSQWTGLTGSVSLQLISGRFSEALISIHYLPSGTCPTDGSSYKTYDAISAAYPNLIGLENLILKQPTPGTSTVTVNETLPVPKNISGCVVVIMDGGPATGNASIKMSSNLILNYTVNQPASADPYTLGGGSEFCFGQNNGCQAATAATGVSFSYAVAITEVSQLLALQGDISDSTFDGQSGFGGIPNGAWGMSNDFYLLRGSCGAFPQGSSTTAANYYAMLPANAIHLLSVPLSGNGEGALQTPVFQTFSNLQVNPGDCIVALTQMTGATGGVDAENQVSYLLQPLPPSAAPAAAANPSPLPIYRLFNGSDHLLSVSETEATGAGYHFEGETMTMSAVGGADLIPIYRCYYGAGHFLSVQANCEGFHVDGVLGYAHANSSGLSPLYRFVNANGYHLETIYYSEGANNGYHYEGVLGYVWP